MEANGNLLLGPAMLEIINAGPLNEGENIFALEVVDRFGNSLLYDFSFTFELVPYLFVVIGMLGPRA